MRLDQLSEDVATEPSAARGDDASGTIRSREKTFAQFCVTKIGGGTITQFMWSYLPAGAVVNKPGEATLSVSAEPIMTFDALEKEFPNVKVMGPEQWEQCFTKEALERLGISFEGAHTGVTCAMYREISRLRTVLRLKDDQAGFTLLIMPKGLKYSNLLTLAGALQNPALRLSRDPRCRYDCEEIREPYSALISNSVLKANADYNVEELKSDEAKYGVCQPSVLDLLAVCVLRYTISPGRPFPPLSTAVTCSFRDGPKWGRGYPDDLKYGYPDPWRGSNVFLTANDCQYDYSTCMMLSCHFKPNKIPSIGCFRTSAPNDFGWEGMFALRKFPVITP